MSKPVGIYVHIPFCETKCPYCNFYSLPNNTTPLVTEARHRRYIDAIISCINTYEKQGIVADTLYFGGGTPSLLKPYLVKEIIDTCKHLFALQGEITLEANPSFVAEQQLIQLREAGVNRLSFGLQSAVPQECNILGRRHSPKEAYRVVQWARRTGFENLSLDLMIGVPRQTTESLKQTLVAVQQMNPEHLSVYMLKIEPNTPFSGYEGSPFLPDEDTLCDQYLLTCAQLESNNLLQYEISNFAIPGYESKHNLKYWRREPYLGFGPSAHSFFKEERFFYPDNLVQFVAKGIEARIVEVDSLSPLQETLMLRLRLTEGLNLSMLSQNFEKDLSPLLQKSLLYEQAGFLIQQGDCLSLTSKGFLISNAIIGALIDLV